MRNDDPGAFNDPQADPILELLGAAQAIHKSAGSSGWQNASPKISERADRAALLNRLRSAITAAASYVGGAPAQPWGEALLGAARELDLRCANDALNPCFDGRPTDVPGRHWGGEKACPECTMRAAIAGAEGR